MDYMKQKNDSIKNRINKEINLMFSNYYDGVLNN